MKRILSYFVLMTLAALSAQVSAITDEVSLLLLRSTNTLYVKKGRFILKSFKVALGSGGRYAKLREGDGRTPTGKYKIMQIRESGRFHLFMQLNYPNIQDAKRALIEKNITQAEYRLVLDAHIFGRQPPQNLMLGGAIGIHGIGLENKEKVKIHQNIDWTEGCIALRNAEVEELSEYVSVGTVINIVE
ncbi:MAG: murein L,D-transpeptidase YafK [Methylophagaceae bacterium]|jgi:murein L,D-transpeptidase YafK